MTELDYIKSNIDLIKIGLVGFTGALLISLNQFMINSNTNNRLDYNNLKWCIILLVGFLVLALRYSKLTDKLRLLK
jgi:hypothetical protein